jgi:hypothetical protein
MSWRRESGDREAEKKHEQYLCCSYIADVLCLNNIIVSNIGK